VAAPTITSILPAIGYIPGGRQISIVGTGLDTVTAVTFGATAGTIVSQTATLLVCTNPAKTAAGAVDVVVTNPDGAATSVGGFTYLDDWIGGSLEAVERLLCNCATFRTIMGSASVAAARDRCVWQITRKQTASPFAYLLLMEGGSFSERGNREFQHDDSVAVRLVWSPTKIAGESQKDYAIRQCNAFGKLIREIKDIIGTGTYLVRATVSYEPPEPMADDNADYNGDWDAVLTFSWSI
jgi:hypothetical protein